MKVADLMPASSPGEASLSSTFTPRRSELGEPHLDARELLLELGGDRLVLGGHLLQRVQVPDVALERAVGLQAAAHRRVLGRYAGGSLRVVPESLGLHLLLERQPAVG